MKPPCLKCDKMTAYGICIGTCKEWKTFVDSIREKQEEEKDKIRKKLNAKH